MGKMSRKKCVDYAEILTVDKIDELNRITVNFRRHFKVLLTIQAL